MSKYFSPLRQMTTWETGLAVYSMFFGAGNVVFPLVLGKTVGQMNLVALIGLCVTAVGGPLLGLLATLYYDGSARDFFNRLGKFPGLLLLLLALVLLGPFAVMPRCVVLSYGTLKPYFPLLTLFQFSLIAGLVVFLCIMRKKWVLGILGYILSPLLVFSLCLIILKGLFFSDSVDFLPAIHTSTEAIQEGLSKGYDTLDLLAAIVFCSALWNLLKTESLKQEIKNERALHQTALWASLIAAGLLGLSYLGLSQVAAVHQQALQNVPPEEIISQLSIRILGPHFATVANCAVALACLTTVLSLAVAITEILKEQFFSVSNSNASKEPSLVSYHVISFILVVIMVIFSNLGFTQIMNFIHPVVTVVYPAIIVLAICNILYKTMGFKWVKLPVLVTLLGTLAWQVI